MIPNFIRALRSGRPPTVFGDGEQSRDFTFVDNVVEANVHAMEADRVAGQVFNVACGVSTTVNELLGRLRAILDSDVEPVHAPARPGEARYSGADIARIRNTLGWEPGVDLHDGLQRTVDDVVPTCSPR